MFSFVSWNFLTLSYLFFNLSRMKFITIKMLWWELLYIILNIAIFINVITRLMNLKRLSSLKFTYFISLKSFSIVTFAFNFFLRSNIFSTRLLVKSRYFSHKCRNFLTFSYYSLNIMMNFFNYYVINAKCYLLKWTF